MNVLPDVPIPCLTDIITGKGQVKQILIETHVKSSSPTDKLGNTGSGL